MNKKYNKTIAIRSEVKHLLQMVLFLLLFNCGKEDSANKRLPLANISSSRNISTSTTRGKADTDAKKFNKDTKQVNFGNLLTPNQQATPSSSNCNTPQAAADTTQEVEYVRNNSSQNAHSNSSLNRKSSTSGVRP